ncbi:MAG: Uncharacterised protein [Cryomorphaceae bacterium]|nr:MAG: Uncharacterised protein [Cryomorphaceae bacterium]
MIQVVHLLCSGKRHQNQLLVELGVPHARNARNGETSISSGGMIALTDEQQGVAYGQVKEICEAFCDDDAVVVGSEVFAFEHIVFEL